MHTSHLLSHRARTSYALRLDFYAHRVGLDVAQEDYRLDNLGLALGCDAYTAKKHFRPFRCQCNAAVGLSLSQSAHQANGIRQVLNRSLGVTPVVPGDLPFESDRTIVQAEGNPRWHEHLARDRNLSGR